MPAELEAPASAVNCALAARLLPAMVDSSDTVAPEVRAHAETCLRCQAELARYRHLLRSLRALRQQYVRPTPASVAAAISAIEAAELPNALRRAALVAYVGGAVVATAASAVGMVIWSRRRVGLAS